MLKALLALLYIAFILFFGSILGAAFGAFSGWVVSLTFLGDYIRHVLGQPSYALAELGALLGFAGAFFRSSTSMKKD